MVWCTREDKQDIAKADFVESLQRQANGSYLFKKNNWKIVTVQPFTFHEEVGDLRRSPASLWTTFLDWG